MKNGFSFELYDMVFQNCFIHSSNYKNGNLQLSLFGVDQETNETAHLTDITLEHNKILRENEIVVDCKFKPTLIPQLLELGVLKSQVGTYVKKAMIYPIYTIDLSKIAEKQYCMQLVAV